MMLVAGRRNAKSRTLPSRQRWLQYFMNTMLILEDIFTFLKKYTGGDKLTADIDIFKELGIRGDDFHEMISDYQKTFGVEMKSYLWYFHCDEEGQSLGCNFFKAPYERVKRISVTPQMLLDIANKKVWNIQYPRHKLPKYRYDILINLIIVIIALIFIIRSCLR